MSNKEVHSYDDEEWEFKFELKGESYVAREATGDAAEKYRAASLQGSVFNTKSKDVTLGNIAKSENILVGHCVFNTNNQKVGPGVVKDWPSSVVSDLFDRIKKASRLDEDQTPEQIKQQIAELQSLLREKEEDEEGK